MSKSNSEKQRKQRDTVIPNSNPCVEHHRKGQVMALLDGTPKGLHQVLEERGFNVKSMRENTLGRLQVQ